MSQASSGNVNVFWRRAARRGALALLLFAMAAASGAARGDEKQGPDVGDYEQVQAPAGNELAFRAYAEGVQIYRWNGAAWVFAGPEAVLYTGDNEDEESGENGVVGIHYGGPTWESLSGSKVVGAVIDRATPDVSAIPWLLLGAVSNDRPGIFSRITYIQRLYTEGGLIPTEPGEVVGEEARVPYTAWYFFYREQR